MITLDGLQMCETADSQALLIALSLIYHSENILGKDFSSLQYHRLITLL
jgi:hypothetical protein